MRTSLVMMATLALAVSTSVPVSSAPLTPSEGVAHISATVWSNKLTPPLQATEYCESVAGTLTRSDLTGAGIIEYRLQLSGALGGVIDLVMVNPATSFNTWSSYGPAVGQISLPNCGLTLETTAVYLEVLTTCTGEDLRLWIVAPERDFNFEGTAGNCSITYG